MVVGGYHERPHDKGADMNDEQIDAESSNEDLEAVETSDDENPATESSSNRSGSKHLTYEAPWPDGRGASIWAPAPDSFAGGFFYAGRKLTAPRGCRASGCWSGTIARQSNTMPDDPEPYDLSQPFDADTHLDGFTEERHASGGSGLTAREGDGRGVGGLGGAGLPADRPGHVHGR